MSRRMRYLRPATSRSPVAWQSEFVANGRARFELFVHIGWSRGLRLAILIVLVTSQNAPTVLGGRTSRGAQGPEPQVRSRRESMRAAPFAPHTGTPRPPVGWCVVRARRSATLPVSPDQSVPVAEASATSTRARRQQRRRPRSSKSTACPTASGCDRERRENDRCCSQGMTLAGGLQTIDRRCPALCPRCGPRVPRRSSRPRVRGRRCAPAGDC